MKSEQRLLLAMGLTFLVLFIWSSMVPQPQKPPAGPSQDKTASMVPALLEKAAEPILEGTIRSIHLGVGAKSGGIRELSAEGIPLLAGSNPGLFEVELLEPAPQHLQFQSQWEGETVVSQAFLGREGLKLVRRISRSSQKEDSLLECKLQIENNTPTQQRIRLRFVAYRPLSEKTREDRQYRYESASIGGKIFSLALQPGKDRLFQEVPLWIAAQGKSNGIILQPAFRSGMFHVEHSLGGEAAGWLELPELQIAPGEQAERSCHLYAGPMSLDRLRAVGLEEAIHLGSFSGVGKLLLELLVWLERRLHNYGLAIVLLSVGIWLLFFPMTWSGIRTMKVMGHLQPQMDRIRKEHGKSPQKMNQEMLELYRKHRVNPLSGCLPLLFQMPIFISLYQVLTRSPQLRGASFLWMRDLAAPDALIQFPSPVPLLGSSLNILPILMAAAMFFQQRITQRSQSSLTEEQRMQQQIFKWFPILFGFMFYHLPSGLVLYWVSNTLLTLGQQLLLLRML
ncbi:MAG: membrane protein insertase YidC [Candidatus Omnitrophica bacterium]|nr:membrane protein insertase YidC [Candidatus Omnitrophota bacterium]